MCGKNYSTPTQYAAKIIPRLYWVGGKYCCWSPYWCSFFSLVHCVMCMPVMFHVYWVVMATISKRRWNEASILASFSISKRNEPANSRTCKDRSEANLLILHLRKIEAKQILFIPQIRKKRYVHVCINFKTLYLKKYASFLNEIFSESFCIHILLAQWIWAL